jgi:hypothetical protein
MRFPYQKKKEPMKVENSIRKERTKMKAVLENKIIQNLITQN